MRIGLTYSEAGRLGGIKTRKTAKLLKKKRIKEYQKNPKLCIGCNSPIDYSKKSENKFCSRNCAAVFNNANKRILKYCLYCKKELINKSKKYCSINCDKTHKYNQYILEWKSGLRTGLGVGGCVTPTVKKYLRLKYGNKCSLCDWNKTNIITGEVPLVADHIDGNYLNNKEENLRLICWNCDSIGSTFGNLNKGNGRTNRH